MKFTEERLRLFAAPLSETEDKKCKNAIGMVRDALKVLGFTDDSKPISKIYSDTYAYSIEMRSTLGFRKVKLFIQGSYANNTNVRTQSDVDIAVVQEETFQPEYRPGISGKDYSFSIASTPMKSFKDEVEEALVNKFGKDVERKNKSIKIHGNTYRKDADSVPCMRYRDYRIDYNNDANNYIGGIYINADDGTRIINYPEQHIENGRKKNTDTSHYYKKMVRIIKNMRYLMEDSGYNSAYNISSFGLESLLWNIPNDYFGTYSIYRFSFDEIIKYLINHDYEIFLFKEANGIKALCSTQSDAEKYKKFMTDLNNFYEYDI